MKRVLLVILSIFVIAALAGGGAFLFGLSEYRAFLGTPITPPGGEAELTVEPGTSLRALGRQLDQAGIIKDRNLPVAGSIFYLWAHKVESAGPRIRAGEYLFEGPHKPAEILEVIVEGRVRTYRITVPEGLRLDEIAPLFEVVGVARGDELLSLAFDEEFVRSLGIDGDSMEGYLFPTTYNLPKGLPTRRILEGAYGQFQEAWRRAEAQRREGVTLDKHEAVTLASIIDKETGQAHERPLISCVFHNRLKDGWRLQTDPTVIYAKILRTGGWDGRLSRADLEARHPYNTYVNTGLPPGPIAAPGGEALKAALNPPDCPYYFFVSRNDGSHEFCDDYACHARAVRRWQNPRYGLD
ncbi:MAG: endolytic transglycosylase MltG [Myxococcota bacterium]